MAMTVIHGTQMDFPSYSNSLIKNISTSLCELNNKKANKLHTAKYLLLCCGASFLRSVASIFLLFLALNFPSPSSPSMGGRS